MTPDPVTLAILKGRLEGIADEMDATLFRSAFNPIILVLLVVVGAYTLFKPSLGTTTALR